DGIAAWNIARHFYAYWSEVRVDWEAHLREWLSRRPATSSRAELRDALGRLLAPQDDGHLRVIDPRDRSPRAFLPISLRPVGDRWAVDASQVADLKPGDVVEAVEGRPAAEWFTERMELLSGSPQYKRWLVAQELASGPAG